jgi:hypothetical protein
MLVPVMILCWLAWGRSQDIEGWWSWLDVTVSTAGVFASALAGGLAVLLGWMDTEKPSLPGKLLLLNDAWLLSLRCYFGCSNRLTA